MRDNSISKRNHLLDIARIIAMLFVVMVHCTADFVMKNNPHTSEFFWGNIFDSISRIGVPLFLMISGALFLDEQKEVTIKSIICKNVKNIALITIVWAIIYSVANTVIAFLINGETVNIKKVLEGIANGHYHMWYLYMIMGLYIMTPLLKKVVCKENKHLVLYFILVSYVVQFLWPTIDKLCVLFWNFDFLGQWIGKFRLYFFDGYVTYFLVGWYIVHIGINQKYLRYIIYSLSVISLFLIILCVNFTGDYEIAYEYIGAFVIIYSVGAFLAINNMCFTLKEKTARILARVSDLTFGVYLIHVLVLRVFSELLSYRGHCLAYILVWFIVSTCCSYLAAYVFSKIPVLRKLIRA